MGMLNEDIVVISQAEKKGDPTVITVNCLDKIGLGCDLCRIIFLFGLSISKVDTITDGKWCYIMFWVMGKPNTSWNLLKKRLMKACPSYFSTFGIDYYSLDDQQSRPPDVFLLKFRCSYDGNGLLHDVTQVLCQLELTIKRVKISTAQNERKMHLVFVTDTRKLLHTIDRQKETKLHLKIVLEDKFIDCEIELTGPKVMVCLHGSLHIPSGITEDIFNLEAPKGYRSKSFASYPVSIALDNNLSPSHTLIRILCWDHKGLLYDIKRTLKDYNIQVEIGRHIIRDREWEVYRILLDEWDGIVVPLKKIEEKVRNTLMGWESL